MIKASFHLLDGIKNFSARKRGKDRNKCTSFVAVLELYGEWRQAYQFPCAYEIRSTTIYKFKFYLQVSSDANDQTKCLQFAAFRDHGLGYVAL